MSPEEERSLLYLKEKIAHFMALDKYELVFKRYLIGKEDVPAQITAAVAIFPRADCDAMDFIMIDWKKPAADAVQNYKTVLDLPPIAECEETNPQIEREAELWAAENDWPLTVLCLGQTQEGHDPVAILWYAPGANPQTSLAKLQDCTKSQQARLN